MEKKVALKFDNTYRFKMGDKVTAILDRSGKLSLRDDDGGLEVFESWADYVRTIQKEKPVTGSEEDILDQLSNTLGDPESVEDTREAPKTKLNPVTKAEEKGKGGNDMATKKAAPLKKVAAKAEKVESPCHCGCKRMTSGKAGFAPGHDARVHGWGKKIADGRLKFEDINKSLHEDVKDGGASAVAWLKAHGVKQGKAVKAEAK